MSLRLSLAAAAALIGMAGFAAPASAVMQVIQVPDPTAPGANTSAPDGLFDKSFSDHWQKPGTDGQQEQGLGKFHFTVNGSSSNAGNGFAPVANPSAADAAKQPGSEFYQAMPGSSYPYFGH